MVAAAPRENKASSRRQFVVRAHRDEETGGWWADSDDIPGLVTEAATYDELVSRITAVLPELCRLNNVAIADGDEIRIGPENSIAAVESATTCVRYRPL